MRSSVKKRCTITLDDDPLVHRIIAKITGVPSLNITNSREILSAVRRHKPMAIFIDVHLGIVDASSLETIPLLRQRLKFCPIIVITSDPRDTAVAKALELGADDFILKPLRAEELRARLAARIRDQSEKESKSIYECADITVDASFRKVKGNKHERFLSAAAVRILIALIEANGLPLNRPLLKKNGWGNRLINENTLDKCIHEIRSAISETSRCIMIEALYGNGFVLKGKEKNG